MLSCGFLSRVQGDLLQSLRNNVGSLLKIIFLFYHGNSRFTNTSRPSLLCIPERCDFGLGNRAHDLSRRVPTIISLNCMARKEFPTGVVHEVPDDLRKTLMSSSVALDAWGSITPLARNEFICWIEDAKRPETRANRIEVALSKLEDGERRPCCWIGCIHRTDKAISPSIQGILDKRKKK